MNLGNGTTIIEDDDDPFIKYRNILNSSSNVSHIMRHVSAGI